MVLALLMLSNCILVLWYFNIVDFPWMVEQTFAAIGDVAQREQARKMVTKTMMLTGTMAGAVVGVPVLLAVMALYFALIGKVMNKDITFEKGFALSAWASVPSLILLPLGALQILLSTNGQLSLSQLNPLSLNQLFFQYDLTHPLASLLDAVNVTNLWSVFLLVIGFETWVKVKRATAIKVVVLPVAAVYGAWLAYGLSKVV